VRPIHPAHKTMLGSSFAAEPMLVCASALPFHVASRSCFRFSVSETAYFASPLSPSSYTRHGYPASLDLVIGSITRWIGRHDIPLRCFFPAGYTTACRSSWGMKTQRRHGYNMESYLVTSATPTLSLHASSDIQGRRALQAHQ
jgi:hypothetical protein